MGGGLGRYGTAVLTLPNLRDSLPRGGRTVLPTVVRSKRGGVRLFGRRRLGVGQFREFIFATSPGELAAALPEEPEQQIDGGIRHIHDVLNLVAEAVVAPQKIRLARQVL